jgi:hypothetical protein
MEIIETTEATIVKLALVSIVERKDISLGTVLIKRIIQIMQHMPN